MTSIKFYSTRDSAVAVLRKAGIDKANYAKHIVTQDGKFGANLNVGKSEELVAAEAAVQEDINISDFVAAAKARNAANVERLKGEAASPFQGLGKREKVSPVKAAKAEKAAKVAIAKAKKPTKEEKAAAPATDKNVGVSEWIRGMITAGKTNKEILDAAESAGHDLTGKKRYFPSWYRFDMKRKAEAAAAK